MKRKICTALAGTVLCFCLTGCGPSAAQRVVYGNDEEIARQSDTYFYVKHLADHSGNLYSESFGSFTGSDTIWSKTVKDGTELELFCSADIEEGDWKLALISPDDTVTILLEGSGDLDTEIVLTGGKWRLKSVGLEAKGRAELTVETEDVK